MNLKKELNEKSKVINSSDRDYIEQIKIGNNDFVFNKTTVKTFFVHNDDSRLYVFLSAIGIYRDAYPIFNRVSWHDKFNGIKFFFDDPSRLELKFSPSFYFGNSKNNYLNYIKDIIEKTKRHFNIDNKDITFISSSNGGFGCIYLANEFVGSRCIALCPQLDVKLYLGEQRFDEFKKRAEIIEEETDIEIYSRLNLYRIINNNETKFIIFSNVACESDRLQMNSFCSHINFNYKTGLNRINDNFYLIVASMDNVDPHKVQPDENFCGYLSNYFWSDSEEQRFSIVSYFINSMYKANIENFKFRLMNSLFSIVKNKKKIHLVRQQNRDLDIYLNDDVYVRISMIGNLIRPNVRFKKSIENLDLNKVYEYVKVSSCQMDESSIWVNIFGKPISVDKYHEWFTHVNNYVGFLK